MIIDISLQDYRNYLLAWDTVKLVCRLVCEHANL